MYSSSWAGIPLLGTGCCLTLTVDLIRKVVSLGFAGSFDARVLEGSFTLLSGKACIFIYIYICLYGIQKWQKDTILMKSSKSNQWLYLLSSSTASALLFHTSFCAIILSSNLFLFQKLSSQFFFVPNPPLFAHPFCTTALHSIFHTSCVAHRLGPATCYSATKRSSCFMAWHWWCCFTFNDLHF